LGNGRKAINNEQLSMSNEKIKDKSEKAKIMINRVWAMPHKWTFTIKPIKHLLNYYVLRGDNWIDPFAGKYSPAEITNDLNPKNKATYNLHAEKFLQLQKDNSRDGCLFDPPYSTRQIKEIYQSIGIEKLSKNESQQCFNYLKPDIARIIKPGGVVICFGWNSSGMGKNLNFEVVEILLISHGGSHNDTIVTVERKLKPNEQIDFEEFQIKEV
jgi:hypothetical protein